MIECNNTEWRNIYGADRRHYFEREGNLAGFQANSLLLKKLTGAAVPIVCLDIELFRRFVLNLFKPTSE